MNLFLITCFQLFFQIHQLSRSCCRKHKFELLGFLIQESVLGYQYQTLSKCIHHLILMHFESICLDTKPYQGRVVKCKPALLKAPGSNFWQLVIVFIIDDVVTKNQGFIKIFSLQKVKFHQCDECREFRDQKSTLQNLFSCFVLSYI